MIKLLVSAGGEPNVADLNGLSAIDHAVEGSYPPVVECLFDCGAKIEQTKMNGRFAISMAVSGNEVEIARLLLKNGAPMIDSLTGREGIETYCDQRGWIEMRKLIDEYRSAPRKRVPEPIQEELGPEIPKKYQGTYRLVVRRSRGRASRLPTTLLHLFVDDSGPRIHIKYTAENWAEDIKKLEPVRLTVSEHSIDFEGPARMFSYRVYHVAKKRQRITFDLDGMNWREPFEMCLESDGVIRIRAVDAYYLNDWLRWWTWHRVDS